MLCRWFHEELLDCCRPLNEVRRDGLTLGQVGQVGLWLMNGYVVRCDAALDRD